MDHPVLLFLKIWFDGPYNRIMGSNLPGCEHWIPNIVTHVHFKRCLQMPLRLPVTSLYECRNSLEMYTHICIYHVLSVKVLIETKIYVYIILFWNSYEQQTLGCLHIGFSREFLLWELPIQNIKFRKQFFKTLLWKTSCTMLVHHENK